MWIINVQLVWVLLASLRVQNLLDCMLAFMLPDHWYLVKQWLLLEMTSIGWYFLLVSANALYCVLIKQWLCNADKSCHEPRLRLKYVIHLFCFFLCYSNELVWSFFCLFLLCVCVMYECGARVGICHLSNASFNRLPFLICLPKYLSQGVLWLIIQMFSKGSEGSIASISGKSCTARVDTRFCYACWICWWRGCRLSPQVCRI